MQNFKNIVGSGFPNYVDTQLKKRAEILNTPNRSNNILQYLTNRNVWFRLSSSVNVGGSDALARNNVLQGGTLNKNRTIKKGFNETYKKGTDDDLGFKPMPGITNMSIGTGGKWQTLMQADIEFVCYDLEQLDTMTKLYMSLGYTVFLEWGHSNYFTTNNNVEKFETNSSTITNFFNFSDKDKLLKQATKERDNKDGNYECMLGTVYNFDWTANNDGSYNCKIQVMGAGGIVESLKINTSSGVNFNNLIDDEDTNADFASDLENVLTTLKKFFEDNSGVVKKARTEFQSNTGTVTTDTVGGLFKEIPLSQEGTIIENNQETLTTYGALLNRIYEFSSYRGPQFGRSIGRTSSSLGNNNINKGNAHQVLSGIGSATSIKSSLYNGYISNTVIDNDKTYFQTYITLGHLFTLIQHIGIFTENSGNVAKPVIYLDYNPDNTIIKVNKLQGSIDPSKCLIPFNQNLDDFFDPVKENFKSKFNPSYTLKKDVIPGFEGKLFNVLVNLDFIIDSLKGLSQGSDDKEVNLLDFITKILDGINVSLGKINSFRPFYDKDSNCLRIIDEHVLPDSKENNIITIPNLGTKSIVYDYSFNTKITPKFASQIVIAAQAGGQDLRNFSSEVLSYQYLNIGTEDRFSTVKNPSINPNIKLPTEKSALKPFFKLFQLFTRIYGFDNIKKSSINSLTTLYDDILNRNTKIPKYNPYDTYASRTKRLLAGITPLQIPESETEKENDILVNPTLILPIEYSIKIDGISGVLPYNIFRIPDSRLPKKYRGKIDFAVFSINHEIESNRWYTILRGIAVPRNK